MDPHRKKQAFKSFLETTSPKEELSAKNHSDHEEVYEEEYVEQSTECGVCGTDVPDAIPKKKLCGFCELVTCVEHLRKRRRKKNKWERICDNCQDKFLFESYMKLEIKAQEALGVEEEIVSMKYYDMKEVLENKKVKRREVAFRNQEIQSKFDQQMDNLIKQDNRFLSIGNRIESDDLHCAQIVEYIDRMQKKIKENYEEDFNILSEENDKISKELSKVDKKCSEVRQAIERREKDLQEVYESWERKMYKKEVESPTKGIQIKDKQKCTLF